jgi:hypothetical protein
LSVTAIIIAGQQGEVTAVIISLLKQDELGIKGALTQADVDSHSFQRLESVHIVLHPTSSKVWEPGQ